MRTNVDRSGLVLLALTGLLATACNNTEAPSPDIQLLTEGDIAAGTLVALSGSGSSDPNEGALPLTYAWSFTDLPADSYTALNRNDVPQVSFVPDVYGEYTVELLVDNGELDASTELVITVVECGNAVPTASGLSATPSAPITGDVVQLAATAEDSDNAGTCALGQELSWEWALTSLPDGSLAFLNDATLANPSLVADRPGDYGLQLVIHDDTGRASAPATLMFTADTCGNAAPMIDAVATLPATPVTGDRIDLDITVSDADIETCSLTQDLVVTSALVDLPSASMASLVPAVGLTPAFVADLPGEYIVRTTVTDDTGRSASVDTEVTVGTCGANPPDALVQIYTPIIDGPGDALAPTDPVSVGGEVWLDASASTDPDTDPLGSCALAGEPAFRWRFDAKPPGSVAQFNDSTLAAPGFTPDAPGIYVIVVEVDDGMYTDEATVTLNALPALLTHVAPGYTLDFVDGGTGLWDNPMGVTVDGAGDIIVVQSGGPFLTRTTAAGTSVLTISGQLDDPADVEWYAGTDTFFVSNESNNGQWFDGIIEVDQVGAQTRWSDYDELDRPQGLHLYTNAARNDRLAVVDRNNDRVVFFDPTDAPLSQWSSQDGFGGNLQTPWGVTAEPVGTVDTTWVTDINSDEVWRSDNTGDELLTWALNNPRDIERAPTSDALVVADAQSGTVWLLDNCANGPCTQTPLASGLWEPYGLAFEGPNSLLVTDLNGDALYRINGPF